MMNSVAVGDIVKTFKGTGKVIRLVPDNKDATAYVLYKVRFPDNNFAYFWASELELVTDYKTI